MKESYRKETADSILALSLAGDIARCRRAIELRKTQNQDADSLLMEEGNTIVRDKRERAVGPA
jgi:hypothetical protein